MISAVEKIEAARTKLRAEIEAATSGEWLGWREYNPLRGHMFGVEGFQDGEATNIARSTSRADALLIETMHRTLGAQLLLLDDFHERYSGRVDRDWVPVAPHAQNVLALAEAILRGGTE